MMHDYVKGHSGALYHFYQVKKNAYPILVTFGIVCGTLWIATGAVAFFLPKKIYLALGAITTTIFTVVFTCIYERTKDNQACTHYLAMTGNTGSAFQAYGCKVDDDWEEKHRYDSFEFFWASSLFAFMMAAYQLSCAAALVYEEMPAGPVAENANKPAIQNQVPQQKSVPPSQAAAPASTTSKLAPPPADKKEDTKPAPVMTTAPGTKEPATKGPIAPPPESKKDTVKDTVKPEAKDSAMVEHSKPPAKEETKAAPTKQDIQALPPPVDDSHAPPMAGDKAFAGTKP